MSGQAICHFDEYQNFMHTTKAYPKGWQKMAGISHSPLWDFLAPLQNKK